MSKEYLEALERIIEGAVYDNIYTKQDLEQDVNTVKQGLLELKAIKESNPSEALEDLDKMANQVFQVDDKFELYYDKVKQHILKAQEQEKVLKILKSKKYIPLDDINPRFWNDKETYDETCDYEFYLWLCEERCEYVVKEEQKLTEEEFDLLKRYFGNENI